METSIFLKVLRSLGTVIAIFFSFLGYVVGVRPKLVEIIKEYYVGFIEGGIILFIFTALTLTYAYLKENQNHKKELNY